ncbi:hypothetical protein LshimejAT787_0506050 [Lyophyllum shimeji]|uniref:Uncharacterized protein n=1 Tax=Lyophyllum shimeji TaxID=47721 RepID=A0A9P3UP90_LYOSH|nr:hypothetical protein LshimejAT787_0506050 [Lyophyllum shimeji]
MASHLQTGVYELYNFYTQQPLGTEYEPIKGITRVVEWPTGHAAPKWTVTQVGIDTYTLFVSGAFLAPGSGIFIVPSSQAYTWKVVPGYQQSVYYVQKPDVYAGWEEIVLGGRRNLNSKGGL